MTDLERRVRRDRMRLELGQLAIAVVGVTSLFSAIIFAEQYESAAAPQQDAIKQVLEGEFSDDVEQHLLSAGFNEAQAGRYEGCASYHQWEYSQATNASGPSLGGNIRSCMMQ